MLRLLQCSKSDREAAVFWRGGGAFQLRRQVILPMVKGMSSKCRARLDARAAGAADAVLALEARDMAEMTKNELERLRVSVAMVKADAEQKTLATAELLPMRHEVVEMKFMLEEVKRHRANVIGRLNKETKALKDAEEELHREAGDIIDIRTVE